MTLTALYNRAVHAAQNYDGSEASYTKLMSSAIAFDEQSYGKSPEKVDDILATAITAFEDINSEENFLTLLERGGAKIYQHGAVFIRPDPQQAGIMPSEHESMNNPEIRHEPRLRQVVMALQDKGIYFDDLVIDMGRVNANQMRRYPYSIITIPRLNAQIAVADQYGEALFAAKPALPFMNWVLFEKPMAGQADTPFADVQKVAMSENWQDRLFAAIGITKGAAHTPKVLLPGYVKAHRKSEYPLTEEMVVEMAKMYRERHPKKQWPMQRSGPIDRDIIEAVTGDPHWQDETWGNIHSACAQKSRNLTRSLPQILKAHGCHYDLTEEMVVEMAKMTRERDPKRHWPAGDADAIDRDIIEAVTGDPYWQDETWTAIRGASQQKYRGLTRSLPQILKAHGCHHDLTEEMVVEMAKMARERDPDKKWPTARWGSIDRDIIEAVTGDPHWQDETWENIHSSGKKKYRGLTRSLAKILDAHCPERGKMSDTPAPEPSS